MQRHFDKTGRIVIPKEMRKELGFESEDYAEIELIDNKIILSNPKNSKYKQLEFLKERENKLQNIEYILKNSYNKRHQKYIRDKCKERKVII